MIDELVGHISWYKKIIVFFLRILFLPLVLLAAIFAIPDFYISRVLRAEDNNEVFLKRLNKWKKRHPITSFLWLLYNPRIYMKI